MLKVAASALLFPMLLRYVGHSIYAKSHGDASFNEETVSAGEQAARVLHSHFDYRGDDIRPTGGIPMKTKFRKRRSVETVSVSSKSRTISSRASSRCKPATRRGILEERR